MAANRGSMIDLMYGDAVHAAMRIVGFRHKDLERLWLRDEARCRPAARGEPSGDADRNRGDGEHRGACHCSGLAASSAQGQSEGLLEPNVTRNHRLTFRAEARSSARSILRTITESNDHADEESVSSRSSLLLGGLEPPGISVSDAAHVLGVRRATLSAVVNGRAALSPDLALRIEKAFGPQVDLMLRIQAAYDAAQIRKKTRTSRSSAMLRRRRERLGQGCGDRAAAGKWSCSQCDRIASYAAGSM